MDIVDKFVKEFQAKRSIYESVKTDAAHIVESALRDSGIMAITSARVKDPGRLKEKLLQRQQETPYSTFDDIEQDIVDFIGIRIALYFPNDQKKVDAIIRQLFEIEKTKHFPNEQRQNNVYSRRFSGYCATHYRVFFTPNSSSEENAKSYRIEIQVASLLMHAWSEVEHDLTYKQKKGLVSFDEYESLDEINGLMIAGEISLQRLQRTTELRIASENKEFTNHYLLASYIYDRVEQNLSETIVMGDVETLFSVLKSKERLTPKKVNNDLQKVDFSAPIPIAQQIIDTYADKSATLSKLVINTKKKKSLDLYSNNSNDKMVGTFLKSWISLEKLIEFKLKSTGFSKENHPTYHSPRFLVDIGILSQEQGDRYSHLRRFRNDLVHGLTQFDESTLQSIIDEINTLIMELTDNESNDDVN